MDYLALIAAYGPNGLDLVPTENEVEVTEEGESTSRGSHTSRLTKARTVKIVSKKGFRFTTEFFGPTDHPYYYFNVDPNIIQKIFGGEGDDWIIGNKDANVISGGKGNDYLAGGEGHDIYLYGNGEGNDIINDVQGLSTVIFKDAITPEDLKFFKYPKSRNGIYADDLGCSYNATPSEKLIIRHFYQRPNNWIFYVRGSLKGYQSEEDIIDNGERIFLKCQSEDNPLFAVQNQKGSAERGYSKIKDFYNYNKSVVERYFDNKAEQIDFIKTNKEKRLKGFYEELRKKTWVLRFFDEINYEISCGFESCSSKSIKIFRSFLYPRTASDPKFYTDLAGWFDEVCKIDLKPNARKLLSAIYDYKIALDTLAGCNRQLPEEGFRSEDEREKWFATYDQRARAASARKKPPSRTVMADPPKRRPRA